MQVASLDVSGQEALGSRFTVRVAEDVSLIEAALRLRYKVFCEEMGADIVRHDGRDVDEFDPHCEHLVVIDEWRAKVVGTYRILPPWGVARLGHGYAETQFRIDSLQSIRRELFEVGRACVHPAYRDANGSVVLARLWSGLGAYARQHRVKYLAGCASVAFDLGRANIAALRSALLAKHLAPAEFRVEPIRGLPHLGNPDVSAPEVPALLKGYLRLGAWVAGEAAWDPVFDSADFFVLLPIERLSPRYAQRFLGHATSH